MSIAKETILRRVQTALRDVGPNERPEQVHVARTYLTKSAMSHAELVAEFAERVAEYKATVRQVASGELQHAISEALRARGIARLVVPADAPEAWLPDFIAPLRDDGQLSHQELDESDGVLTGCALGIAQTGTIVMDHSQGQGRRAISLVPDYHLCVIRAEQIVGLVPEAIAELETAVRAGHPITFISGPSATSDIELNRVEGVHGPRTLDVLIVV